MAKYSDVATLSTVTAKPQLVYGGDGAILSEIVLAQVGFSSAPADNQFLFGVYENTDMGTGGTAVTPKLIGPGVASGVTLKKGTFSADPTVTGIALLSLPCYMRSVTKSQFYQGDGLSEQAIAANRGLGMWCDVAGGALNAISQFHRYE